MDGAPMLEAMPCEGCGLALAELLASIPTAPVIVLALILLVGIALEATFFQPSRDRR